MFKNMKIGARLGAGFGVVLLIFAISVIISALFLNVVDTSVKQVKTETIPFLMKSYEIDVDVTKVGEILTDICATHNTEGFKEAEKTVATVKANIASFKEMFTKENDTKSLKEIDELEKALNKFYEDGQKMAQVYVSKGVTEGNKLMPEFDKTREKLLQEVEGFQQGQIDEAKANMLNVEKATTNVSRTLYLLGFLSIVIGIVIALFVTRSIIRPLSEAVDVTHRLAEGDLTVTIDIKSKDETGQLLTAMQNMVRQLTTIIADVKSAAENVSSGSQELSSTAEEMSQGATEQAAAAEEASSSMEEMTSNIRQNADNSQQTEKIAIKSATDAREGGTAVSETVKAMKEIAGKITIIEEIARQTNLLALNAAIEAARAGEHGKGFAVVASEVRKLAERSQTAAAEISKLSASSVEVAAKAGEMLTKIVPDIQKTAELVQEISAASNEQNTGAEQINQAIQQLDQVIQQNASASEEMASTAEELASQSEQLQASIAFFRTGDGDGARVRDRAAAKATHKASVAHITQDAGRKQAGTAAKARTAGVAIEMGSAEHDKRDEEFEKY